MSQRYSPGERELGIAGDFARYYRAFLHVNDVANLDFDEETIIALSSTAFFGDLAASTEIQSQIALHNKVMEAEMEAEEEFLANSQPEDTAKQSRLNNFINTFKKGN